MRPPSLPENDPYGAPNEGEGERELNIEEEPSIRLLAGDKPTGITPFLVRNTRGEAHPQNPTGSKLSLIHI